VQGEHAHRIWNAIYSQNCFKDVHSETCNEESLFFYRVISGVHASISMHLTKQYLLDAATDTWGANMTEFQRRFIPSEKCNHVQNLYFAYLFVLKAVSKAVPALRVVHFDTGMSEEDAKTKVSTPCLARLDVSVRLTWFLFGLRTCEVAGACMHFKKKKKKKKTLLIVVLPATSRGVTLVEIP
jgi:hypothetical protein